MYYDSFQDWESNALLSDYEREERDEAERIAERQQKFKAFEINCKISKFSIKNEHNRIDKKTRDIYKAA